MGRLFMIILLSAYTVQAVYADIIYLNNGDEIKAKVESVETNEVKYKRESNPNGPTFSIMKQQILMIIYANGEKDIFQNNQSAQHQSSYVNHQNAYTINDISELREEDMYFLAYLYKRNLLNTKVLPNDYDLKLIHKYSISNTLATLQVRSEGYNKSLEQYATKTLP